MAGGKDEAARAGPRLRAEPLMPLGVASDLPDRGSAPLGRLRPAGAATGLRPGVISTLHTPYVVVGPPSPTPSWGQSGLGLAKPRVAQASSRWTRMGMAHRNGEESVWAMLESGCHWVCHRVSPTRPQRNSDEFLNHDNPCDSTGIMLLGLIVRCREGKRVQHRERTP